VNLISDFIYFCQAETGKKTLILHGTKTSVVLNSVLSDIYHLKRDNAMKRTKKNYNIRLFESGECSLIVVERLFGVFDDVLYLYELVTGVWFCLYP
jgi:hypothetical protein